MKVFLIGLSVFLLMVAVICANVGIYLSGFPHRYNWAVALMWTDATLAAIGAFLAAMISDFVR